MSTQARPRLEWIDGVKGLAILWIVFFHTFKEWDVGDGGGAVWAWVSWTIRLAYHSVGVFFLMSGVGLALSMARGKSKGWPAWFRSRVARLFPMYWLAHVVIAVSPLATTWEPVDYRFGLSLLGDRFWPVEEMFYYLNASWWYFGTLLQLYLLFPLLWILLERVGAPAFLAITGIVTIGVRYWLLVVDPAHGYWVQGAFGVCRMFELAFGMAIGVWLARAPEDTTRRLFSPAALAASVVVFAIALWTARQGVSTYALTDGLAATSLFVILAHAARALGGVPGVGQTLVTLGAFSYGLYLLHQPYVITLGLGMRGSGTLAFFAAAAVTIGVLAVIAMQIEKRMNGAVSRVL